MSGFFNCLTRHHSNINYKLLDLFSDAYDYWGVPAQETAMRQREAGSYSKSY